jgi:alpha/beta superfamily hydrolase
MVLAGYSFGAMIAAGVAAGAELAALVLVSPPVGSAPLSPLDPELPTLLVAGDRDGVAPAAEVQALAAGRRRAVIVEGVDHSWWPGLDSLEAEIRTFLESLPA